METTLHRQLKQSYAGCQADTEVTLGSFRIDAVRGNELIEIQCASLSALSAKARRLLMRHPLRVVKPITHRTRIIRLDKPDGKQLSRRLSPKTGTLIDVFDDLIYFTKVFPHPNLTIELLSVDIEQFRIPAKSRRRRRFKPDYSIHDVCLEAIVDRRELHHAADLLDLIQWPAGTGDITTEAIAAHLDRPRWVAQKIAYVLKHVGAITPTRRSQAGIHYAAA